MKDFLGNELKVVDYVTFTPFKNGGSEGRIIRIILLRFKSRIFGFLDKTKAKVWFFLLKL